ncbi:MAG: hypothetical protein U0W24_07540 [Bacteroidales bacterium]
MKKQKQALFILIFAFFSWADITAQLITEDILYLNNGWIIKGKIIGNLNDSVKIESYGGNVFVFANSQVIKKDSISYKTSQQTLRSSIVPEIKGFYNHTTLGLLIGSSTNEESASFSFQSVFGYSFNRFASVGLGVGVEKLRTEIIPLFVSFRSVLGERFNAPVVSIMTGYSFPMNKNKEAADNYDQTDYSYTGGFNFGVDLGIYCHRTQNRAFTITAGYRYQYVQETQKLVYWWENSTETNTYRFNRLSVKIGFLFM